MPYKKLRRVARWLTGPLVLSLLTMCLPSAGAVTAAGRVDAASRCAAPIALPSPTVAPQEASATRCASETETVASHVPSPRRAQSARRSAPAVRNPRNDKPRGAGIGPGSRMRSLALTHALSTTPSAGATYQWEGAVAMTNTGNGNKLTKIPLFGWTARGGMPVELALYHNSQGTHNSELGYKWTFSFDIYMIVDAQAGTATVHWGDDLAYTFEQDESYNWVPPSGIHDTLTANGNPVTSYDLKTKDQITYRFTKPNGAGWMCTKISDLNGNEITIGHNGSDYITTVTDPTSRQISLSYDGNGRITTITDPQSRQWTVSYTDGNLTQIAWPSVGGNSYDMEFGYNANHCVTTLTDRRGKNWTFSYNADNSLAWQKDPLNNQTSFAYASGQTTVTDPNSRTVKHNWTSGRVSSIVDQLNNTESYTYDSANNRTRVTDRMGEYWDFTYDSSGNVLTATDPLDNETEITYNGMNEVLTVTTPMGKQVVNTYDGDGNLTKVELKDSGGVVRSTTEYAWDAYGSLVTKTDDNDNQTSYEHNGNGHLTKVTTPNGRETEFAVNGLGVRTSRTDAMDRTTSYTLDNWLRVTAIDYPSGTDPGFSYDAENHLTGWTDGVGTWARTFDDAGRITAESLGGNTRVSYTWDATGKKGLLSSITDANSRTITYSYTYRNQLYQVSETAGTATYAYNANGQETGVTNQNGTTVSKVLDDAGRLASITNRNSSNTVLSSFDYTYNDDDMRTYVEEADDSTVTYAYNGIGRLTGETRTGTNAFTASYTVDGEGNRTSQTIGANTTSFTLNDDYELTATSGGFSNSYSYNANGEQTGRTLSATAYTLGYDFEGQLTQITQGQNTTDFVYDALGRRYSRTAGGTTTVFYYAGNQVLLEKQGDIFTGVYTYGNSLLRRNSEYPLYDGHGSERTVTNGSETVTGTINFEAFGQTAGTTGSSSSPYMYAGAWGYRTDGDAGLMHVGARYYDAQVGRFITRDDDLDEHPYLYCDGDPVNYADPDGRAKEEVPPRRGGVGPNGKPKIHNVKYPSKGRARQGARDRGYGEPVHHQPKNGRPGHYHSTYPDGSRTNDGVHHNYRRWEVPEINWGVVVAVGAIVVIGGAIIATGGAATPLVALAAL